MTRDEALLKLLALEPETKSRLIAITGWNAEETVAVLEGLVDAGKVTYRNGSHGALGERRYYPSPKTQRRSGALPIPAGASRTGVRDDGGGLVRGERTMASGRAGQADTHGSRAQALIPPRYLEQPKKERR